MARKIGVLLLLVAFLCSTVPASASAYNAKPKLVVVIVVDQLRQDLLERYHDDFGTGGFRLFMEQGAWFSNTYYQYANTKTAPGHATLGTGTYSLGHGIFANDFWEPNLRRMVSSVQDDKQEALGADIKEKSPSASPHNLLTDTLADELKLATRGKARTFGVALKDRSAILPVGYTADGAFWIDHATGVWLTSTYYTKEAPAWLVAFNKADAAAKYLNREWKDRAGNVLRTTAPATNASGDPVGYYDLVGITPFGNDYTLDIARAVIENEKLGTNDVTDLISISFSSPDILGHKFGPDSEEQHEMLIALDRQLATFFSYLTQKFGRDNLVLAISADHGAAPLPEFAANLRLPAFNGDPKDFTAQLNTMIGAKLGKPGKYVVYFDYPTAQLDQQAFLDASPKITQAEAEQMVGEFMVRLGMRSFTTKSDLAAGRVGNSVFAQQIKNAYSPEGGWYVISTMPPFVVGYASGTGHALPYSYDAHVPLGFYGPQFRTGEYRDAAEPVDLAVTLASILGINKPASAVGRVLTEGIEQGTKTTQVAPVHNK